MSSDQKEKRVQDVVPAVVVSTDSQSPEAILSRNAQTVQLQASTDSHYDTVLERYVDMEVYPRGRAKSSKISGTDLVFIFLSIGIIGYVIMKKCR